MDATSWQKEQISVAFVHAIATRAHCTIASWNVDKDGVDVSLKRGSPQVDLQLKCTQRPLRPDGGFTYDLDVATYDKLRAEDRSAPGYLVVVLVPPAIEDWMVQAADELLLRCSGLYACIQDRPVASAAKTTAIHLPTEQVFDELAIEIMMDFARERIMGPRRKAVSV